MVLKVPGSSNIAGVKPIAIRRNSLMLSCNGFALPVGGHDNRSLSPNTCLDEVRKVLRLHHYSIHTERSYVEWIVRFVRFHGMRSRAALLPAEPKIESFLTDLAVNGNVAAATQNQAMNALVFLYKRVLNHTLEGRINAVRADKKINLPLS